MDISTLYVGQGALTVVRHAGEAVIVDSLIPGADDHGPLVEANIHRLLKNHTVAGLILTGFDSDHCSVDGVEFVLSHYKPEWVMYPKVYKDTDCATDTFTVIRRHERQRASTQKPLRTVSVRLDQINSRQLSGLLVNFECELFSPHIDDKDNSNNSSIVLKLTGTGPGGFSYLITGDTMTDRWSRIAELFGEALRSDVLAAPHHGALSGASADMIYLVQPNTVLISAGHESQYGHPHGPAVQAYAAIAEHVYATNIHGGVSLFTKRVGADFNTQQFN